jgi:hypothetical protein
MTIGTRGYRETREVSWMPGLLVLPFRGRITGYAINRRQWANGEKIDGCSTEQQ